jgi:spermidine/putrescine ABC transporter ATP-binding subunit
MAYVELENITAGYVKGDPVLQDFNLHVEQGELLSLLGPSGCGKTTTLRTVAGFLSAQAGSVRINGKDYTRLPPNRRNIGLVFQNYALFPHLSVFDNVAYGLKRRGVDKSSMSSRVHQALAMVSLQGYEDRLPTQLSGGQRQRVALARAVVIEPDLLLLDEPLSNLDAKLRDEMRGELSRLQARLGITMIYVTHDQIEALSLSSRIVIMNQGEIEQSGAPEDIYDHPKSAFVAHFMGYDNVLFGTLIEAQEQDVLLDVNGQRFRSTRMLANLSRSEFESGRRVRVLFRPEQTKLLAPEESEQENVLTADLDFCNYQGNSTLCSLDAGGQRLQVRLAGRNTPEPTGARVYVEPQAIVLDKENG